MRTNFYRNWWNLSARRAASRSWWSERAKVGRRLVEWLNDSSTRHCLGSPTKAGRWISCSAMVTCAAN